MSGYQGGGIFSLSGRFGTAGTSVLYQRVAGFFRSDNGPEFTGKGARSWLKRLGVQALFVDLDSPWENRYNNSFNGTLRDELLNKKIFTALPRGPSPDRAMEK